MIEGTKIPKRPISGEILPADAGQTPQSMIESLAGYRVEQIDATNFVLKHKDGPPNEEFKLQMTEQGGKIEFIGMPELMKKFLLNFD